MSNVKISAKPASSATYDGTEFLAGIQTGADAKFAANQIYAAATKAATPKLTPVAGDLIGVADSAASFGLKSFSWAAIQQYFTNLFGSGSATTPTDFKDSVAVATTANITLSGEQTIDGVLTSASRVLVKDQTVGSENGIYVSAAGAWTRSTDADTSPEVTSGMLMYVESGTVSLGLVYTLITNNPIVLATTALVFQAIQLPSGFFVYKTVAGTTYTHILLDANKRLLATNAAAKAITIAPQSSVASAVNTEIEIYNAGAGLLTITPGAGVTINSLGASLTVPQNHCVKLKKRASPNTWDLSAAGNVVLDAVQVITALKTFGTPGGAVGKLGLAGSTSGTATLDAPAVAGSNAYSLPNSAGTLGYVNVPSNPQSANYTTVADDAGKSIDHPSTDNNARTFTIAANASVAYALGTCLSFSNVAVANLTIAINSDTMYLGGTTTTGNRTLITGGHCTARKVAATVWIISGPGLS